MTFALVFPGQGSQAVGMMAAYGELPVIRATFDEAADVLGQDLWKLVAEGPAETLNLTVNTQPAMLAAGVAVYRAWRELGGAVPSYVAGHSLGEYSALVAAGAIAFRDALPLVRLRAEAMQQAVPQGVGAMAALLGLDDEAARAACAEAVAVNAGEVAQAVNYNSPGQVVIAGHKAAVERAVECAKAKGAKRAILLPVSGPFHSSLMQAAAESLAQKLQATPIATPQIAVINNVDVGIESDPARIRDALLRQLYNPVRWVEVVRKMASLGVTRIGECGPGKVLAPLAKRIQDGVQGIALADRNTLEQTAAMVNA
jgi:[acyl-carrier-protein] S-malonyltransferase